MKKGFTLAELLVTIGVIGVVAALAMVGMTKMIPDKNKPLVLKKYNEISELTEQLLSNPLLYMPTRAQLESEDAEDRIANLQTNTQQPTDRRYQNVVYSNETKYAYLLADAYGLGLDEVVCAGNACQFTTPDGTKFSITSERDITLTMPNNKPEEEWCSYSEECTDPVQFVFQVDENGAVTPFDPLTKAYVQNAKNLNNKKADFQLAKDILNGNVTVPTVPDTPVAPVDPRTPIEPGKPIEPGPVLPREPLEPLPNPSPTPTPTPTPTPSPTPGGSGGSGGGQTYKEDIINDGIDDTYGKYNQNKNTVEDLKVNKYTY